MKTVTLKMFVGFSIFIFGISLISSCGSTDAKDSYPVEGTWEEMGDDPSLYFEVNSNNFTQYEFYSGDCYIDEAKIVNKDGDMYTFSTEGSDEEVTYEMVVNNDVLTTDIDGGLTFERTDVNLSTFDDECSEY